jgi:hypothetical protein
MNHLNQLNQSAKHHTCAMVVVLATGEGVALAVGDGDALVVGEGVALVLGEGVALVLGEGVALAVGDGVGAGAGDVEPPPPPPPLTVVANEVIASPAPPTQGSNPAWTLVRYHESVTLLRVLVSLTKSRMLKSQLGIGDGAT